MFLGGKSECDIFGNVYIKPTTFFFLGNQAFNFSYTITVFTLCNAFVHNDFLRDTTPVAASIAKSCFLGLATTVVPCSSCSTLKATVPKGARSSSVALNWIKLVPFGV